MYIAILGRQPALGMAELERLYGAEATQWFGDSSATVETNEFDFERLGGTQKAGRVVADLSTSSWKDVGDAIVEYYLHQWSDVDHKITLGISAYGWNIPPRQIQKTGIILKKKLRDQNVSLRLIPNENSALSTATSHHNKLGLSSNKVELLVVHNRGRVVVAESVGSQNITALAARDQARPKTDAFVGMLPPKLARMLVNMAIGSRVNRHSDASAAPIFPDKDQETSGAQASRDDNDKATVSNSRVILDPFCGTGVVLQEALLLGYDVYGSDLSEKMVDYSQQNLDWLTEKWGLAGNYRVEAGDAMTYQWIPPVDAVVAEGYLGQPFSAPPSREKLIQVHGNCNHIISSFLDNISRQVAPGTPICLAVPAWNDGHDRFTHLPLTDHVEKFGFRRIELARVNPNELLYYRPGQVVARELLVLEKI